MAKRIDFYLKTGSFNKEYYNPNAKEGAPIHPFRLCEVGPSGVGKSNTILEIIKLCACFSKIFLVSANGTTETLWLFAKTKLGDKLKIVEDLEDLPELPSITKSTKQKKADRLKRQEQQSRSRDEADNEPEDNDEKHPESDDDGPTDMEDCVGKSQKLIIFEDQVYENKERQRLINTWFCRSRNHNYSVILTSQRFFDIPRTVRANSNYFILFAIPVDSEIIKMIREIQVPHSREQFIKAFKDCTAKHKDFMLIDGVETNPIHKVRHNWDTILKPVRMASEEPRVPRKRLR